MLPKLALASLAIALAAARVAHADPIADFKTGTTVLVRTVTVNLDGLRSTGDIAIAKSAGTLDLELHAADIGLTLPIAIHLHGSSRGAGRITYTIDDTYSPAVDLGNGQRLSRVTGRLDALVSWLPGTARPEIGNVQLTLLGASSYIAADVAGRTQRIPITSVGLIGGVLQPPLVTFVDTGPRLACSDTVPTEHTFAVSLTDAARDNGAPVELKVSLGGGVRLPRAILVPAGRRSAIVTAVIESNFVGTVRVTAAAAGSARALDLAIHAHRDCK